MTVTELPRDLLRSIALRSLHGQGSSARHWLRLSLVCKDWRGFLQGASRPICRRRSRMHSVASSVICLLVA